MKRASSGAAFQSPVKRYTANKARIVLGDFDTEAIRRTIHDFYEKKEYPTLKKLLSVLREKGLFRSIGVGTRGLVGAEAPQHFLGGLRNVMFIRMRTRRLRDRVRAHGELGLKACFGSSIPDSLS